MKPSITQLYGALFLIHQLMEWMNMHSSFVDSYLDDFLFLPLFIYVLEKCIRIFLPEFKLNVTQKIVVILYAVAIVEFVFPLASSRFIFDWFDLVAYGSGYITFLLMSKIFNKHSNTPELVH